MTNLTFEEIASAFYDLYGDEPSTDGSFDAEALWETLDTDIQQEIEEYLL